MSRATSYLVEQIREKDQLISTLLTQAKERQQIAWDEGWHEHYLEWERQKLDPSHPITSSNPYKNA